MDESAPSQLVVRVLCNAQHREDESEAQVRGQRRRAAAVAEDEVQPELLACGVERSLVDLNSAGDDHRDDLLALRLRAVFSVGLSGWPRCDASSDIVDDESRLGLHAPESPDPDLAVA